MSSQTADLVLYNANILTVDSRRPRAELVAVGAGEIVWVGCNDDLELFKARSRLINCEGRTVVPGFNDAHIHVLSYASKLLGIDCSPSSVTSISDIQREIRRHAQRVPPGTWLKAHGYNEFYLAERRHPTRRDLDLAAPNHPVRLEHRSQHACVLNSMALSLAGISVETPDPPGGQIDREIDTGEPSGLLFGMSTYMSDRVTPAISEEELEKGVELADKRFLSSGITSVQDTSVKNKFAQWQTFRRLKDRGKLTPRVSVMFGLHAIAKLKAQGMGPGYGDSQLRVGGIKMVLDEVGGRLNPPQDELNEDVFREHKDGFQVAMHAVEEGTVEAAAAALEYCMRVAPREDHRHRIEHCSVCPPQLMQRLKSINPVVVTQPAFIYYSGERYLQDVPEIQLPWLYRTRSFLESGLGPAASSDCPVVPFAPLIGLYAAVTRKAESGQVLSPEQVVSPEQALQMYTLNGAYASFEEHVKGSIEVGKLADMVVLSADPTEVAPDEIKEIRVEKTIIGGEIVWEL
ncbi:MAG: amidohydrolase [Dehalococcoidia bacterium]|nr:MAG: amidohydrolase [Dehalococcoidia bacterium]